MLDAIKQTHKELEFEPFITRLLGTDEILKQSFSPDTFIAQHSEKIEQWQMLSKNWYLY